MVRFDTLLELAKKTALKSTYRFRLGAVIFNKSRIISTGCNKIRCGKRKLHPRFKKWEESIHAEAAAILNARTDLKGSSILICRLTPSGESFNLAKPCKYCMSYIQYVGLSKVYYTIGGNDEKTNICILKV